MNAAKVYRYCRMRGQGFTTMVKSKAGLVLVMRQFLRSLDRNFLFLLEQEGN